MRKTAGILAVVAVLALAGSAQANLIQDPSFSSGTQDPWFGVTRWHDYAHGSPYCARISYTLDTPIDQTLSMNLDAGTYDVSFLQDTDGTSGHMLYDIGYGGHGSFVKVDGFEVACRSSWGSDSGQIEIDFGEAVGQALTVRIWVDSSSPYCSYVDDVEMTFTAAIPEPLTMSLLALGGVGLLIRRRRK